MAITDFDKIDFIFPNIEFGDIKLIITDHLDWIDENYHINALTKKLNSYLNFIESEQIKIEYPDYLLQESLLIIEIWSKYDYPNLGISFVEKANDYFNKINVRVTQKYCIPD